MLWRYNMMCITLINSMAMYSGHMFPWRYPLIPYLACIWVVIRWWGMAYVGGLVVVDRDLLVIGCGFDTLRSQEWHACTNDENQGGIKYFIHWFCQRWVNMV